MAGFVDPFRLVWGWKSPSTGVGPFCFESIQTFTPGAETTELFSGGSEKTETFAPGAEAVKTGCP